MRGSLFLVVEFPAADLPLTGFTAAHPGTHVDLISEPLEEEGGDRVHPSILLVSGAPPDVLDALVAQLAHVYSPIHTLERDDRRRVWLARVKVRESALRNPGALALAGFQHRFGIPWTHLEEGIFHMRARVENPDDGELLADQVRRYLRKAGTDAQVELQEISARDYGVWEDLVQHAIGLNR